MTTTEWIWRRLRGGRVPHAWDARFRHLIDGSYARRRHEPTPEWVAFITSRSACGSFDADRAHPAEEPELTVRCRYCIRAIASRHIPGQEDADA